MRNYRRLGCRFRNISQAAAGDTRLSSWMFNLRLTTLPRTKSSIYLRTMIFSSKLMERVSENIGDNLTLKYRAYVRFNINSNTNN